MTKCWVNNIQRDAFSLIYAKRTKGRPCQLDDVFPEGSSLKLGSPHRLNSPTEAWKSVSEDNKPVLLARTKLSSEIYFAIKNPDNDKLTAANLKENFYLDTD